MEKQQQKSSTESTGLAAAETGSDFFNQFFSGALERAGMTRNDLAGQDSRDSNPSTSISNPNSTSLTRNLAADGHGLDCGNDPGPSAEQLQEEESNSNSHPTSTSQSISQSHSVKSPSSSSSSRINSDDPELLELTRALSQATTLNPNHSTSNPTPFSPTQSQPPSRSSIGMGVGGFKDHSYFAHQRGGGLGTPTGERTQLGGSLKETPSASLANSLASLNNPYSNQSGSGNPLGNLTPVMDKDGFGWPGE